MSTKVDAVTAAAKVERTLANKPPALAPIVTFMQLERHHCRWPLACVAECENMSLYCGTHIAAGEVYCAAHKTAGTAEDQHRHRRRRGVLLLGGRTESWRA